MAGWTTREKVYLRKYFTEDNFYRLDALPPTKLTNKNHNR